MKHFLTSLAILLATFTSFAQAPNRISYQAEVRNSSNNLVVNQPVGIRISILQGSNVGTSVYTETHTPTTNANGLVSLQIGGGTVVSGVFATINWGNGPYFLKTETDPAGGTNYSITGTNQLLSVPYALFSNSSNTSNSAANGLPSGGGQGQVITMCNGTPIWTTGGICPGTITALNCSTATNSGVLGQGIAAASVSSSVPYTGGNGGSRSAQSITSTGVTGLTATCAAGTFATGSGSLTYTITGTPASTGTASFALNIGGRSCTLTRTVLPAGTITALSCSTATNNGTLTRGVAAASVNSSVPYTGGNGGYRSAQTRTSTGVTGLTATCAAGTFATGAGSLTYTITGTPASSGTASFALTIGGQTCTLTRTVNLPVGTITALNCSTATNTGTLTKGIAAVSVSTSVPYTGGNGGTYAAQTIASTGVTGLTATLAAGTLLSGAGSLTYTITGTPASSGTASFALNIGGKSCTLTRTVNIGLGPLNIETALIPAGTFTMGSPTTEVSRGTDEVQRQVTLSAYRMSKYETSNAQFVAFLNARNIGDNGLYALGAYPTQPLIYANGRLTESDLGFTWSGTQWQLVAGKENFPVVNVTWYGAAEFATYAGGRLPKEAEWEYACRAGTTTPFNTGTCLNNTQANYNWGEPLTGCTNTNSNPPNQAQAINSYSPNAYGLYNMHGNVQEWCADWYGDYPNTAQTNPSGPSTGLSHVFRGGEWYSVAQYCRSAYRCSYETIGSQYSIIGFRLVFAP